MIRHAARPRQPPGIRMARAGARAILGAGAGGSARDGTDLMMGVLVALVRGPDEREALRNGMSFSSTPSPIALFGACSASASRRSC